MKFFSAVFHEYLAKSSHKYNLNIFFIKNILKNYLQNIVNIYIFKSIVKIVKINIFKWNKTKNIVYVYISYIICFISFIIII